eukprot:TRINITY_DN40960_c0_g1_i1.p2 TRINITY_DN40960_c0_g1~~TRINITY_DN40960_c0_g1_i1.p2  ORF type:complete len:202 (+),score=32.77 TRINITY_DN40960_c0_g1_i1:102-707(+)
MYHFTFGNAHAPEEPRRLRMQQRSHPYARKPRGDDDETRGAAPAVPAGAPEDGRATSDDMADVDMVAPDPRFSTPPRARQSRAAALTPPPVRPESPPLLRAFVSNSEIAVGRILHGDPGLATTPFFEHQWEMPLCCAVRHGCSVAIISHLLKHGAQWSDTDMNGRTALDLLRTAHFHQPPPFPFAEFDHVHEQDAPGVFLN